MHARFAPRRHQFRYRIFLFALDLDELETLPRRLALFSVERPNLYSFRGRDYFPTDEPAHPWPQLPRGGFHLIRENHRDLKTRIASYLAARGVDASAGRVLLITLPRVVGYGFNPVSFYFCQDRAGRPRAAIAEVTNTFREIKPYFLGPEAFDRTRGEFRVRLPKHFYVSPYSDVDTAFDFTLRLPEERLSIQIDDYVGAERTLTSTLAGPRRELTNARLAWFTVKYPLLTLRIIGGIHWHALRLWWKRVPWFAKAARAEEQRGLYRPHVSIAAGKAVPAGAPAMRTPHASQTRAEVYPPPAAPEATRAPRYFPSSDPA